MARLTPDEKQALREFARGKPLRQPALPAIPIMDYLQVLSSLPESLRPPKPVRFTGNSWKL